MNKCTGFHENCDCEECSYVNMLYAELDFLEQFEPENKADINRIKDEIENMGYCY